MSELPKNLEFKIKASWDGKSGVKMMTSGGKTISTDTPSEFGGLGASPCPDELFLASIAGCVLTTFLWFVRKKGIKISDVRLEARSEIELAKAVYTFRKVKIFAEIFTPEEYVEAARSCLDLAIKYCHIFKGIEHCIPIEVSGKVLVRED